MNILKFRLAVCAAVLALGTCSSRATSTNIIGSYSGWDSIAWKTLSGVNDNNDGLSPENDVVGDATDPAGYWAKDSSYVYFRMRVASGTYAPTTYQDAHLVMIDIAGGQVNPTTNVLDTTKDDHLPDYAFSWDSKSNDTSIHGLEMSIRQDWAQGALWNGINFNDLDGVNGGGSKGSVDINGGGRTTDGYLRVVDGVGTTNFGTTSFIDYAVSWSYLSTYTQLTQAQMDNGQWRIAFGTIHAATDHNNLTEVSGNVSMSASAGTGMTTLAIPEPATGTILIVTGLAVLARRRAQSGLAVLARQRAQSR